MKHSRIPASQESESGEQTFLQRSTEERRGRQGGFGDLIGHFDLGDLIGHFALGDLIGHFALGDLNGHFALGDLIGHF